MAMSAAASYSTSPTTRSWDVIATADADTGNLQVAHGFPAAPALVFLTERIAAAHISNWVVTSIDATNITITKTSTGVGSGNAGVQLTLTAMRPHSLL